MTTGGTAPYHRAATCLAKLGRITVFMLTLRALHAVLPQLRGILRELPVVLHNLAAFLEKAAKDERKPDE